MTAVRSSWFLVTGILLLHTGTPAESLAEFPIPAIQGRPTVAVLPLVNYTQNSRAVDVLMPHILGQLEARGICYLADGGLRPILRTHRIRSTGSIRAEDARSIQEATGVEHLLLGSFDIYETDGSLEVGLSARIVRCSTMKIVHAASSSASGENFAGMFGIGRIDSIDVLAEKVVARLFKDLDRPVTVRKRPDQVGLLQTTVVLVPFDNYSEKRHAGSILTNILLTELVANGYIVIEPGMVNDLFLRNQILPTGEIDYQILRQVADAFHPSLIVTGVVESFRPGRGDPSTAIPTLEFGVRVLEARHGRILAIYNVSREGRDSETILGFGRYYALGRLAQDSLRKLVRKIQREEEEHIVRNE